ncbi:metallophosphoesterase [Anatilimnocola floriformis]|uniref:metallophosphoesterase n=1 Tax=Anatilimnocola floriformis TaxID=2948575 RepID=UPI0020C2BF42|nr:metallophosphoesterase [Anatilimnocola floriformis]
MSLIVWMLLALATAGHFALALWLFNRLHARAWRYRLRQLLERILVLATFGIAAAYLFAVWKLSGQTSAPLSLTPGSSPVEILGYAYVYVCLAVVLLSLPIWAWPKLRYRSPTDLVALQTRVVDMREAGDITISGAFPQFCAKLPGNEIWQMHVQRKHFRLLRLPSELRGLRIVHLTDMHLTGKLGREFYEQVVTLTNELEPDLIVVTGDIVEREKCLPWVEPLFGRLRAKHGKFFILGNHDFLLPQPQQLRNELQRAGFFDLAGTWTQLEINGARLLLAGNELPWHGPAPQVPPVDEAFRILLAHTPDLFTWAQQESFDLMLAGHNHGGQICLPLIGALVSPSNYGVRYAAGMFRQGPTLMHVSRGIAGEHLLRWNCPPELTLLILE